MYSREEITALTEKGSSATNGQCGNAFWETGSISHGSYLRLEKTMVGAANG